MTARAVNSRMTTLAGMKGSNLGSDVTAMDGVGLFFSARSQPVSKFAAAPGRKRAFRFPRTQRRYGDQFRRKIIEKSAADQRGFPRRRLRREQRPRAHRWRARRWDVLLLRPIAQSQQQVGNRNIHRANLVAGAAER